MYKILMGVYLNSLPIFLSYLLKSEPCWPDGPIKHSHPVEEVRNRLQVAKIPKADATWLEMDAHLA